MEQLKRITFRILLFLFFITYGINAIVGKEKGDTLSIPLNMNYSYTIECSKGIQLSKYDHNRIKGIPKDTSLYKIYNYTISESDSMLVIIAKDLGNRYYCSFDTNRDFDFDSEYKYYFTKEEILAGRDFIPQMISSVYKEKISWYPIFPIVYMNGVPRRKLTINSLDNFDGFVLTVGTGAYFYGSFKYRGKTYCLVIKPLAAPYDINSTDYCLYDTLMTNNDKLFDFDFRNVSYSTVYGNNTFKVIDIDFQKERCSLLVNEGISYLPYKNGMAPLFNIKDINGKNIDLAKLRGKFVLIDFWGSWCNPCIALIPKIKKIHEENPDLIVISIAHDQEDNTLPETRKIIAEKGMDWINIYQCDREMTKPSIATMYNIYAFPTTILIDPQGKIIYRDIGNNKYNELNTVIRNQCNSQNY